MFSIYQLRLLLNVLYACTSIVLYLLGLYSSRSSNKKAVTTIQIPHLFRNAFMTNGVNRENSLNLLLENKARH